MRSRPRVLVIPVLLLALLLAAPLAAMPVHAAVPPCEDSADLSAAGVHVVQAGHRSVLWHETNGLAGLQEATCHSGGRVYDADRMIVEVLPRDLGLLGLCSFLVVQQCV